MGRSAAVKILNEARDNFCGIGTRKTKLWLNKLAKTSQLALAYRIAIEIEDASSLGKKYAGSRWSYRSYNVKNLLIHNLIFICDKQGWIYGYKSGVIYFDLPGCEQISFHCQIAEGWKVPTYQKEWDGKRYSTFSKLETAIRNFL